jgi:hypothetical protein
MSGLPGGEPGATHPNWVVDAWNSAALDVLAYQREIAAGFSRETDRVTAAAEVLKAADARLRESLES